MTIANRYRVGAVLACGGMAEVRDGWDTRLDRPVAIKLLHPHFRAQPEMRRRFRAEALAAASLNHPNIACVFDSGEYAGVPYIVMERLPGSSVADELVLGPLAQARVRRVLDDVLSAVDVAHRAGILHRDIKPGNILHSVSGGTVKIADFGIAKALDADNHTKTGEILGTMGYLSPERIAGAPASIADDLYAIGVVGFEALTGCARFTRDNAGALAHAIMTQQPPPIHALRPDVEPELAALIERATMPDPYARFTSAAQMLTALRGEAPLSIAATAEPTPPVRSPTKMLATPPTHHPASLAYVTPRARKPGRRTKMILTGVGAAAIAAAVTTIAVAASRSAPAPVVPATQPEPTAISPAPPPASRAPQVSERQLVPGGIGNSGNGKGDGNGKKGKKGKS